MNSKNHSNGFTLLELLVVISIIAILIGFIFPNFLGGRERARDQKRKSEVTQLKNALQLYYNDYKTYPASSGGLISGCGASGTSNCTSGRFTAGSGSGTVYMSKLPQINGVDSFEYYQCSSGEDFRVITELENLGDPDISDTQSRCPAGCGITYNSDHYVVCAD